MAEDVLISGSLFDITLRNAAPEASDAVTGDKVNITNMALAHGLTLMWDYGERINGQSSLIEQDLTAIGERRTLLEDMLDWTPADFDSPAAVQMMGALNQLFDLGVGQVITDKVRNVVVSGGDGQSLRWPALTNVPGTEVPIGDWASVQNLPPDTFFGGRMFRTSDGVYFYCTLNGNQLGPVRQAAKDDIVLVPGPGDPDMNITEAEIAQTRRELEINIESMTQINQDKQAFLQDLVASLQKWFTFVNSMCDRRKRDADTIVGNFR